MNRQNKGTLSEKFSKIAAQNINVNARQTRKIVVVRGQANRRAAQANAKRGISTVNRQDSRRTGAQKRPPMKNQSRPAVRGKGRGGKGNSGRRNKDNNKASPKSQSELDLELDTYWFAAGKGPNPVAAALDKDMDNYFKDRTSKAEEQVSSDDKP